MKLQDLKVTEKCNGIIQKYLCLNVVTYSNFMILCNCISWAIETSCVFTWRHKSPLNKGVDDWSSDLHQILQTVLM